MKIQNRLNKSTIYFIGCFFLLNINLQAQNSTTFNAQIEYLEKVNNTDTQNDPLIVLLLMQQYLNTNQQERGIAYFDTVFEQKLHRITNADKALYLNALGILRATYAEHVFLPKRISWVNKTVDKLEEARQLTNDINFISRWSSGVVYAQLPWFFNKKKQAYLDLNWVIEHADEAPLEGFLREVYFQLARLHHSDNNDNERDKYLALSQYKSLEKDVIMISSWAIEHKTGLSFRPWKMNVVIPNKVYNVSSVEFTEYNFIVSDDGKELISIDMGSRPEAAKQAYDYLKKEVIDLPPLTTVIMTHSHGDHIGGYDFFKQLNPNLKVIAMYNHDDEWNRFVHAPDKFYLFGTGFTTDNLQNYSVDQEIEVKSKLSIGGTQFDLIPIEGGETPDAMFIYLPKYKVLYVGDFIMPMMGDPLLEEGNIPGLFSAIDVAVNINPTHLLHGHYGLNYLYPNVKILADLKDPLEWLYKQTLIQIEKGVGRTSIHHLNLIAPSVFNHPNIQLQYLINRENFINRAFDRKTGYWQLESLDNVDILSHNDYGILLNDYLHQSEGKLSRSIQKMLNNGEYDLAFKTLQWSITQYPNSKKLNSLFKEASRKMIEKFQFTSPFKMSLYSFKGGQEVLQIQNR